MAKGLSLKVLMQLQMKEFQQGLKSVQKQLNTFKNYMKSAFALGSVTMFGKQMIEVGKDFENAMAKVQAVSNATSDEFKKMQKEAQKMGETTRYTATEAANALENLTRNGMSATQATKSLSSVLQLAQANAIGLSEAADIMTNIMNAYGLSVADATRINDVMSSTAGNAATNISALYEAMAEAGPYAKIMGKSIEEVAAGLGVMANNGIKGSVAGKAMSAMFQRLSSITPKAQKVLDQYGITISEAELKSKDFASILKKLADSGIGKSVGALSDLFGKNYAGNIATLVNSLEDFNAMLNITQNSAGTTARMFDQSVGSVQKEIDTLKSKYEGLLVSMSQKTSGAVKSVVRLLQNLIDNFKTVGGTIMNIASVAVPLLTTKVLKLGREMKTFFTMVKTEGAAATAMMGGWITMIATLVTWIGTALYGAWQKSTQAMRDAKKAMAEGQTQIAELQIKTKNLIDRIGDGTNKNTLNGVIAEAIALFPEFESAIRNAHKAAEATGNYEKLKGVLQDIADLQATIISGEITQGMKDAQVSTMSEKMWRQRSNQYYQPFTSQLDNKPGIDKDFKKKAFNALAEAIFADTSEAMEVTMQRVMNVLNGYTVSLSDEAIKGIIDWTRGNTGYATKSGDYVQTGANAALANNIANTDHHLSQNEEKQRKQEYKVWEQGFENLVTEARYKLNQKEINKGQFNDLLLKGAKEFDEKVSSIDVDGTLGLKDDAIAKINQYIKYPPEIKKALDGNSSTTPEDTSGGTDKSPKGKIKDIINEFNEESSKLNSRLEADTITTEDYNKELAKLQDKTWEAITAFEGFETILEKLKQSALGNELSTAYAGNRQKEKDASEAEKAKEFAKTYIEQLDKVGSFKVPKEGQRDTTFDYTKSKADIQGEIVALKNANANTIQNMIDSLKEGIQNGDFDLVKDEAIRKLFELVEALRLVKDEATDLQHKMNLSESIVALDDQIKDLQQSSFDNITGIASAFDRLYDSIQNIAEAFGEEIEWEGFEKFMSVVNASIQMLDAFKTILTAVQLVQDITSKKKVLNAAKEVAANEAVTASEVTKASAEASEAVAGGASAVAGIPVAGPALAVAAAGAIIAALMAGMGKFANGGIIGGASTSGDRQLARVNSGEMILNKGQQSTLFNAINNGALGSGNVEFKLKGTELIGVIKNTQSKLKG